MIFTFNVEKVTEELTWRNLFCFDSTELFCSEERGVWVCVHKLFILLFRLGLIEWIENTFTLKDFLLSNMSREEKAAYTR